MYFRFVLMIFYLEELIIIGILDIFGLEVYRFKKCIIYVLVFNMFLFMLILMICVLFLICLCVILSVLLYCFFLIKCLKCVELVMLVCLFMLINKVLGLILSGFKFER